MKESQLKAIVQNFLKQGGLEAVPIPEGPTKTPDFEVLGDCEECLVELKTKEDDPRELEKDRGILAAGGFLTKSRPIAYGNSLANKIEEGCRQFAEYDGANAKLHILWLHCVGIDAQLLYENSLTTLFGTAIVVSEQLPTAIECYYFGHSAFIRYKDMLDAAIVSHDSNTPGYLELQFCVNCASDKISRLRATRLYKYLAKYMYDPDEQERKGAAFIADVCCPRNTDDEVLSYLRQKYGLNHLQVLRFAQDKVAVATKTK
jgi:hypothetical protein